MYAANLSDFVGSLYWRVAGKALWSWSNWFASIHDLLFHSSSLLLMLQLNLKINEKKICA